MDRSASRSTVASNATADTLISQLDISAIQRLAVTTRLAQIDRDQHSTTLAHSPSLPLSCDVVTPPKIGGFHVVYFLEFSDGISWVIRIPFDKWDSVDARFMETDILSLKYIMSQTSLPIPRIHGYSCEDNNTLSHPYTLMDKIHGTRLIDVWNDPAWWTGERSKERFLASLAEAMIELASLEFDQIGRLERPGPDAPYHIGPFPPRRDANSGEVVEPRGPYNSTYAYFSHELSFERRKRKCGELAMLQLFMGALLDTRFDSAPFSFGHPDFDSQNVFVDDTGRLVGLIDWDGVSVLPRQLGALTYPNWLTVDWNPTMYDYYKELPNYDTEEELHAYREMYTKCIRAASGGRFDAITRNSHLVSTLYLAITDIVCMTGMTFRLGEFIFCSTAATDRALLAIEHSAWFTCPPEEVAEVKLVDEDDILASLPFQGHAEGDNAEAANGADTVEGGHGSSRPNSNKDGASSYVHSPRRCPAVL